MEDEKRKNNNDEPLDQELEGLSDDVYENFADLINEDKNHKNDDIYQYEEGEGNADSTGQRDVADTGDHGLGSGDSSQIDNSNVLPLEDVDQDDGEENNDMKIY